MTKTSARKVKTSRLSLTGEFTIQEAARLKSQLLECLSANKGLEIDMSGVTELDSAGVQLMLLLQREASAAGKSLQWVGHSQVVKRVLSLLNLGSAFGDPVSVVWS